ncbi:hypothetical protein OIU76_016818 [Salix suchowensis]|nr:hypothetical protein OIU76_016818 [Salix suchowensis]
MHFFVFIVIVLFAIELLLCPLYFPLLCSLFLCLPWITILPFKHLLLLKSCDCSRSKFHSHNKQSSAFIKMNSECCWKNVGVPGFLRCILFFIRDEVEETNHRF